jgi:chromosomal replication initiation ATPase DnaA
LRCASDKAARNWLTPSCLWLQEIGRQFGGRHHTTVLHSIKKIEELRRSDEALNRTITRLMLSPHCVLILSGLIE